MPAAQPLLVDPLPASAAPTAATGSAEKAATQAEEAQQHAEATQTGGGEVGFAVAGDIRTGHVARLVADDQVILTRIGEKLIANAPPALAGRLEVRGLGIMALDGGPVFTFNEEGVATFGQQLKVQFGVTDGDAVMTAHYEGILPDLFRENQAVIATGRREGDVFIATQVLAKHDEQYMPREVAEAMGKAHEKHKVDDAAADAAPAGDAKPGAY